MDELALCLFPVNCKIDFVRLLSHQEFTTFEVTSEYELRTRLKRRHVFCILICCSIREPEDIYKLRKIRSAFAKFSCLAYGRVREQEFIFKLAEIGFKGFVRRGDTRQLLAKLRHIKEQTSFRINLYDFRIDNNRCRNYWTNRFLDFIQRDANFLKYPSVMEIADLFGTSPTNLGIAFKRDCWLSPKQLMLCLRNYYAAYLLSSTLWSSEEIAYACGFPNQHCLYKSFRSYTGKTVMDFRRHNHWHDYPQLFLSQYKPKNYDYDKLVS